MAGQGRARGNRRSDDEVLNISPDELPRRQEMPEIRLGTPPRQRREGGVEAAGVPPAPAPRPALEQRGEVLEIEPLQRQPVLEIPRPERREILQVPTEQIRPRNNELMVIRPEDLVAKTTILEPRPDSEVGREVRVVGEAHPQTRLRVATSTYHAEVEVDATGRFTLERVPLRPGENEIVVTSRTHPSVLRCQARVRVVCAARPLLYLGRIDPLTRDTFGANDRVVRCQGCGNFSLADSWAHLRRCAYTGCRSDACWNSEDDHFYAEDWRGG